MRIPRSGVVLVVAFLPAAARGDQHHADAAVAVSVSQGSLLLGGHASYARSLDARGRWSVPFEATYTAGSDHDLAEKKASALVGVRRTFSSGLGDELQPFLQLLVAGVVHVKDEDARDGRTAYGGAVGAGLDILLSHESGFRAQLDLVVSDASTFPRFSFGLIHRFGEK